MFFSIMLTNVFPMRQIREKAIFQYLQAVIVQWAFF